MGREPEKSGRAVGPHSRDPGAPIALGLQFPKSLPNFQIPSGADVRKGWAMYKARVPPLK